MGIKTHLIDGGAIRRSITFSDAILNKLQIEADARCEGNVSMLIREILSERYKIKAKKEKAQAKKKH